MSATTTSSAAAATCTGNAWVLPVQDVACALKTNTDEYSDIMDKCCKDAKVETYNDECGLYCLAQGQTGDDLRDCLADEGAKDGDYFCGGNLTQTASAAVPSKTSTSDNDDSSETDSADGADNTGNAAVRAPVVNKAGLGVLAMLFCSALMGVAA